MLQVASPGALKDSLKLENNDLAVTTTQPREKLRPWVLEHLDVRGARVGESRPGFGRVDGRLHRIWRDQQPLRIAAVRNKGLRIHCEITRVTEEWQKLKVEGYTC